MKTPDAATVDLRGGFRPSECFKRFARSGAVLAGAFALSATAVGCGGGVDGAEGEAFEIETRAQDLKPEHWRQWSSTTAATAINTDPAICSNKVGFLLTVRNSDQKYYVRRTVLAENPTWDDVGNRQFLSAPSCTMQEPYPGDDNKFLLAGKSTDNRIYAVEGVLPNPTGPVPPLPTWTGAWAQVSSTQYSGSSNARPAIGSNGSRVVLTFVNSNRVYAHYRTLPYSSSSWSSRVSAPVFPQGVTTNGIPAITYMSGSTNKFVVLVRATAGGSTGLYWIYFNGTSFEGNWSQGFVPFAVDSDPAMEWDNIHDALTIYFKSGNEVLQTSISGPGGIGVWPFYSIPQQPGTVILGAPRAVFGGGIEGIRSAVVRGYDSNLSSSNQSKGILRTEVFGTPSPWP